MLAPRNQTCHFFIAPKNWIFRGTSFEPIKHLATLVPGKFQGFYGVPLYHCYTLPHDVISESKALEEMIQGQIASDHCWAVFYSASVSCRASALRMALTDWRCRRCCMRTVWFHILPPLSLYLLPHHKQKNRRVIVYKEKDPLKKSKGMYIFLKPMISWNLLYVRKVSIPSHKRPLPSRSRERVTSQIWVTKKLVPSPKYTREIACFKWEWNGFSNRTPRMFLIPLFKICHLHFWSIRYKTWNFIEFSGKLSPKWDQKMILTMYPKFEFKAHRRLELAI